MNAFDKAVTPSRVETSPATAASKCVQASRLIVQLVPPGTGGIRDYADCLQREWLTMGIDSQLIALGQTDAAARSLADRLEDLMRADGRPCSLVLHFSGYGFHPRGLCFWLANEVESARVKLGARLRVVTMFHELFAAGRPPWKSAFWVSRFQARIASRVAKASDGVCTNTELHRDWLQTQVDRAVTVGLQPVFSTIGEPDTIAPADQRRIQLVVFGAQSTRHRALARLLRHAAALQQRGVTEVVEVGSGEPYPTLADGLTHRFMGRLGTRELRDLLEASAFGLLDYPLKYFGKSTVFAAYAVHGCVSLNTADAEVDTDGLRDGTHFVTLGHADAIPSSAQARQAVADAARAWYAEHRSDWQAQAFAEHCLAHTTQVVAHVF
jgi:hypothetical protein